MIFNYRSIPGLMFNFVEAVLNQRLSTPFGCAGFESPILRLELNWQDLILHLPYLPLCPMTEVDHQQEVELFPPKESLQVVELSPRYVPNFNLHISYWKTVLALNKSGQIPTFCPLFVCFRPALVHFWPRARTLAVQGIAFIMRVYSWSWTFFSLYFILLLTRP